MGPSRIAHDMPLSGWVEGPEATSRLLALWAAYLGRLCGQRRVAVLVLEEGAAQPPLPLVIDCALQQKVVDAVSRVASQLAQGRDARSCEEPPEQSLARFAAIRFGDAAQSRTSDARTGPGLVLTVSAAGGQTRLVLEAAESRYALEDLQRWNAGLATLVQEAARNPDATLAQLQVVGDAEAALLHELGHGRAVAAQPDLLSMFGACVGRAGHVMAASDDQRSLTYRELDERSSAFAAAIAADGRFRSGGLVPLLAAPSTELLCSIVGVLKAGLAYVPLDPAAPAGRTRDLLAALGGAPVVADRELVEPGVAVLKLSGLFVAGSRGHTFTPVEVAGSALAYVMFTSGSTGRPKGVRVTRAGLSNYLRWAAQAYGLDDRDGALVHTSPAADLILTGLLGPLVCGGVVHLPGSRDPFAWAQERMAASGQIGLLKTTPSLLRGLLQGIESSHIRVRKVVLGGEPLRGADLQLLRERILGARIFNEYGPTETVVGSTVFDATEWPGSVLGDVPIGRAIDNTDLAVLDADGQPVPLGVVGDLVIAGAGVADGYLNNPVETAERFFQWRGRPAYRTGDRVCWSTAHGLRMLGRSDDEFKVNGVRCHPAEVEAALAGLDGVRAAAVALRLDATGHARLVAWYVPAARAADEAALREALSARLPAALVPSRFVPVPELPLTPAGKLDRAALTLSGEARQTYEAPRGHYEETLSAVWASVLGVDRVSRNDDYFALGGDSLRSVQASALARKRGIDVSVAQIHANPLLKDLAEVVRQGDPLLDSSPATRPFQLVSAEDRALMPEEVEDAYPLNLLQEGMIYHRDFAPKSAVYHAICSYTIRARLDVPLMRQVIHDLVRRHPLLRTSFDLTTYSRPLQLVHREFEDPVTVIDMRDASVQAFDSAVDGWMEHEKRTGFEVQQHPLIRFCLHVGSHGVFQISYSFHHEIIDGWSDALMVTELLRDYFSRANGEDFRPEPQTATFRDAIAQEQAALANPAFRDFWMKEFADTQLMRLPRLAAPLRADKGDRQIVKFEIPIDKALSDAIVRLARTLAVPVKTVLLAAHMRVMSAMGGGRDTTSYTVGNGRPENADGHRVIGLFVNSLAFRLPMPGGSWRDLIRGTLAKEQAVLPYRRFPMAELKRQAGNDPLSETLFFFNHYHVADVLDGRPDAELLGIRVYGESTFPYCVNAYISPVTKLVGMRVEFDSLQFTPRLLASMESMYLAVVRSMVENPDGRYDLEDLVPPGEREELMRWSHGAGEAAPAEDVVSALRSVARRCPDGVAVAYEGRHMSYAALDRLAGRFAAWLRRRGVQPGERVGIALGRCVEMPAMVLGALRAGCAYVPLDPAAPEQRTEAILADAGLQLVLTNAPMRGGAAPVVELQALMEELAELAPVDAVDVPASWPAYVIYTSGTTGRPKGVQVPRDALARSNAARLAYYQGEHESFLLLSSIAFDSSVAGLFGTLSSGGTLVLPGGRDALDLVDLANLVSRHRVTQTLAVPSLYAAILRELRGGASSLRTVAVAGEAVPADLVAAHAELLPGVKLVNEYGPTEGTVWATAWTAEGPARGATVPIGRPVQGMRCVVADAFDYLSPIGVTGEACLAGPMLAHGYVGRPAETADAFRPDPFGGPRGGRVYRTGDYVRWNASGQLEFCGRRDSQVKIDGFRIELGEIEAALLRHPKVRSCAVQPRPDAAGKARLVAYVALGAHCETQELSTYLRGLLPRFMLPKAYVVLDELPVGASGKIDREALPQPADVAGTGSVLPRTPTEELIAGIWRMVLGVEHFSVLDGFFALGGDSLRAMRIAAATRKALGVDLPMKVLMTDGGSVADLARVVDELRATTRQAHLRGTTEDERDLVRV
jgi:nonribosomal peptide synthetase protein BlmX